MKVLIEGGADVNTQNKVIMYRSLHYTWSHAHSEHVVMSISVDIHVRNDVEYSLVTVMMIYYHTPHTCL